MEFRNIQKKFINIKPIENIILKCKSLENVDTLLHRILYLNSNYLYEDEDRILYIQKDNKNITNIINRYDEINERYKYSYYSLLSSGKHPTICSYNDFLEKAVGNKKRISNVKKIRIINDILENTKICSKKIKEVEAFTIVHEIKYMKNNNITSLEEYNNLLGTPLKLRRNSSSRLEMFNIYSAYNKILLDNDLFDDEDITLLAFNNLTDRYTHIIINNAQDFSTIELGLLMKLSMKKTYSTIVYVIDLDRSENIYSSLVKKGRVYLKKVIKGDKKVFNLNKKIKKAKEVIYEEENYKFLDFKYNREIGFSVGDDGRVLDEDKDKYSDNQVVNVPVFSNIAAGEPILINPEVEDTFGIPKHWIRGMSNKFILKVKGDSMINAHINDGDFVLIEQNNMPDNGDIVAVNIDGSATLKRIKIEPNKILLLPENEKYKPIIISREDEFFVLGKAIGVISKNQ
ncbi:transcriptional repressor LexA [Clostridium sp. MSJ-8]|uniref:transcriptional repressor LexA n=1 Tax=Clostridium sp. MSJ-8 TaxID=2841510 RepID=UPI001C0EE26D|nr:transcriptional repressor LexA [Clostridium sp. MSJ-8]MBU5487437.1 transcriptional repressor LexA [Clostridium sp. MSJ-8]